MARSEVAFTGIDVSDATNTSFFSNTSFLSARFARRRGLGLSADGVINLKVEGTGKESASDLVYIIIVVAFVLVGGTAWYGRRVVAQKQVREGHGGDILLSATCLTPRSSQMQIETERHMIEDLQHKLEIMQEYSAKEVEMIEAQINTFRKEIGISIEAQSKIDDETTERESGVPRTKSSVGDEMQRLIIDATEIQSEEVVGKGR